MKYSVMGRSFALFVCGAVCSFIVTAGLSCTGSSLQTQKLKIISSDGSEHYITAELALTPDEQSRGYMFRKKINDGRGMLFVFEYDKQASFWMKNTIVPLSIAYIDSRGKIRDIFDMTPQSLAPVRSSVSVRYALEVPAGWFERSKISVGDTVVIPDLRARE